MAVFRCKRDLGATVFPRHAAERTPLIVTAVTFSPAGGYVYACSWPNGDVTSHYECELASEWTGYLPDDDETAEPAEPDSAA